MTSRQVGISPNQYAFLRIDPATTREEEPEKTGRTVSSPRSKSAARKVLARTAALSAYPGVPENPRSDKMAPTEPTNSTLRQSRVVDSTLAEQDGFPWPQEHPGRSPTPKPLVAKNLAYRPREANGVYGPPSRSPAKDSDASSSYLERYSSMPSARTTVASLSSLGDVRRSGPTVSTPTGSNGRAERQSPSADPTSIDFQGIPRPQEHPCGYLAIEPLLARDTASRQSEILYDLVPPSQRYSSTPSACTEHQWEAQSGGIKTTSALSTDRDDSRDAPTSILQPHESCRIEPVPSNSSVGASKRSGKKNATRSHHVHVDVHDVPGGDAPTSISWPGLASRTFGDSHPQDAHLGKADAVGRCAFVKSGRAAAHKKLPKSPSAPLAALDTSKLPTPVSGETPMTVARDADTTPHKLPSTTMNAALMSPKSYHNTNNINPVANSSSYIDVFLTNLAQQAPRRGRSRASAASSDKPPLRDSGGRLLPESEVIRRIEAEASCSSR